MSDEKTILDRLNELPEAVQQHIFSEATGDLNAQIIQRNPVVQEQRTVLFGLLKEVFVRDVPIEALEAEVATRFSGLDAAAARNLARDIAGYRLLPLDKYLGDVDGLIRTLGGEPKDYPPERVKIEERTSEEAASEVVNELGGDSFDRRMKERLKDLAESFYAGIRTEPQVMATLLKPSKTGGMELSPDAAARVMDELREEARAVTIKEKEAVSPAPPEVVEKKPDDFSTITPEDDKEIEHLKANIMPTKVAPASDDTARKIAASIDELYAASGLNPMTESLQKRLKTIIGNRLRDVRDSMETLETFVQPKELGGMGLPQDQARQILTLIEAKLKAVHDEHQAEVAVSKSNWQQGQSDKKMQDAADAYLKDESELNTLYQDIASKSKKLQGKPIPPLPIPDAAHREPAPEQVAAPPVNLPVVAETPLAQKAPVPAPPPSAKPEDKPALLPRPSMSIVRPLSPPPPPMPQTRPMMMDVRPVAAPSARLTGPVEELRATTLVDFRRLSKDPKEACLKIKDKVDLLAEQSFTKRTDAVRAWMESEVYRVYIDQMREALEGKSMTDIVAARQAAKSPYLGPEELGAVADLSRNLRY